MSSERVSHNSRSGTYSIFRAYCNAIIRLHFVISTIMTSYEIFRPYCLEITNWYWDAREQFPPNLRSNLKYADIFLILVNCCSIFSPHPVIFFKKVDKSSGGKYMQRILMHNDVDLRIIILAPDLTTWQTQNLQIVIEFWRPILQNWRKQKFA